MRQVGTRTLLLSSELGRVRLEEVGNTEWDESFGPLWVIWGGAPEFAHYIQRQRILMDEPCVITNRYSERLYQNYNKERGQWAVCT
jgi:hypothetical protein